MYVLLVSNVRNLHTTCKNMFSTWLKSVTWFSILAVNTVMITQYENLVLITKNIKKMLFVLPNTIFFVYDLLHWFQNIGIV